MDPEQFNMLIQHIDAIAINQQNIVPYLNAFGRLVSTLVAWQTINFIALCCVVFWSVQRKGDQ